MAKDKDAGKNQALPGWVRSLAKWAIFLGTVLLLVGFSRSCSNTTPSKGATVASTATTPTLPICKDAKDDYLEFEEKSELKVPISQDCWSGWITLPPRAHFFVDNIERDHAKQLQVLFLDGSTADLIGMKSLGRIPSFSFRLRGESTALVRVEPL